jgi:hypothetical protein
MLENRDLVLVPWGQWQARGISTSADSPAPLWIIQDPAAAPVGLVRLLPGSGLRRWLAGPGLSIHEIEDEPLVFTVRHLWGWFHAWEIRDADDHFVGRVQGFGVQYINSAEGDLVVAATEVTTGVTLFCDHRGLTLAALARLEETLKLTFETELEDRPLVKMLIFGAALAKQPTS